MADEKKQSGVVGIFKDAMILFLITLVAGLALGVVNKVTKDPIAQQQELKKQQAYQAIFPTATSFLEPQELKEKVAEGLGTDVYGKLTLDEAVEALDEKGTVLGHVVTVTTAEGFGGNIQIVLGVDSSGTTTGMEILSISESAGLGMNAREEAFRNQYKGKQVEEFTVTKTGASTPGEIDALASATITSKAVTNAVNGALYFLHQQLGGVTP